MTDKRMKILLAIDPAGGKPDLYDDQQVEMMPIGGELARLFLAGEAGLVVTVSGCQGFTWDQRPEFSSLRPGPTA